MSCATACGPDQPARLQRLNLDCLCLPLDRAQLIDDIVAAATPAAPERLRAALHEQRDLFAATTVFLGEQDIHAMLDVVAAIEAARRQLQPCAGDLHLPYVAADDMAALFAQEWRAWYDQTPDPPPLARVAIVDSDIGSQYLLPDVLLAQAALLGAGVAAELIEPRPLATRLARGAPHVDMVYNRLTDFPLNMPDNAALRAAHAAGALLVSPAPQHHALYAHKRNLSAWGERAQLIAWGVPAAQQQVLTAGLPRAVLVTPANAAALWSQRRSLFFKPLTGYGSRGVYRGAKLTRRVWQQIVAHDYVAQTWVPAAERALYPDAAAPLKFDVRVFVCKGQPLSVVARMYQGQTTNFRTPGGGSAPVVVVGGVG